MADKYYTDERNAQIILALLKAYDIRKIVISPGSTNLAIVGSVQNDPYFQLWSAVDERHAAYLACGIADESGEPVVISCTGATAARNYMPGMTEAFYRRLPILCLTSTQEISRLGNGYTEMTDRTHPPSDVAKLSVRLPPVFNDHEASECERIATRALMELFGADRGPVHICLETIYKGTFGTQSLPSVSKISRIYPWTQDWPGLDSHERIALLVGSGVRFADDEIVLLEQFATKYNVAVLCDPTSRYHGRMAVYSHAVCSQPLYNSAPGGLRPDLVIYVGGLCGDYETRWFLQAHFPRVWRVTADGSASAPFGKTENVFVMAEKAFFAHYVERAAVSDDSFALCWRQKCDELRSRYPNVGFSNMWMAQTLSSRIPSGACVHLGILNSLTSWSYVPVRGDVEYRSNVGGFGIDGCASTAIGASIANPDRLHFLVIGDLAFFYDLNAIGNRHVGKNLRILLVNNGAGATFNMYFHLSPRTFGEQTNDFTAAAGHFGRKSANLVKHFSEDLGFEYLSASGKEEFDEAIPTFVAKDRDRPVLLECFVDMAEETAARAAFDRIEIVPPTLKSTVKAFVRKNILQR